MSDNKLMVIIGANDSEFQAKMGRVEKGFQNVKDSVFSLQGALAGLGITAVMTQAIQATNQAERSSMALAVTARYTGESLQETTAAAQELAKDGFMSVAQASQALQNLLSRGYGLEQSVQMMERLKDAAAFNRQSHLDLGEAVVGATEGLKNENSMLVDNAGVTKNVSVMHKEYAAQLGKSVDALTQAEKRVAEYNGIMKETEGQVGNAERMANTFQGAQARLNQELFNSKAALGQALVPALGNVLTTLNPVVGGIRDMVLWVETLGARAGATYDKLALRAELALSGKGMFSKEGLEEYARRVKVIDQSLDEAIGDIVKRSSGAVLPEIGKDTGVRRKDTIIPDDNKKAAKEADSAYARYTTTFEGLNKAISMGNPYLTEYEKGLIGIREQIEKAVRENPLYTKSLTEQGKALEQNYKLAAQIAADQEMFEGSVYSSDAYLNAIGQMSDSQQKAFDKSAMASKWAVTNKESDRRAQAAADDLAADGDPLSQFLIRLDREQEALEYSYAMQTDSYAVYEQRKLEIQRHYDQQRMAAMVEGTQQRMAFEAASAQKQVSMVASAGVQMTNSVANSNKAMFMANKAFRLVEAGLELKAGIAKTFNSFPVPINFAMAALHATAGAMYLADIASASYGGSNGSPGGNYGGGTPTSPIVTQPVGNQQQQQPLNITFNVNGTILSDQTAMQRWFEESAAPTIRDLAVNRNVNFGFQPST